MRASAPCGLSRVIRVLTLVFLGLSLAVGQDQPKYPTDKGVVNGTVTDQTQAVVAGARVLHL